jgi:hypothetical protein
MSRNDWLALVICLVIFLAGLFVSGPIYGAMPHVEDEMAFTWQARLITQGQLYTASPQPNPKSFSVPFVVDYQGKRFGKYPPGWPALLGIGEWLNIRWLINPLVTSLAFWLIYRTVQKAVDSGTAVLTIALGGTSPFVLVNAGSLLSHPWSLFLTVLFTTAWMDSFQIPNPSLPPWARRWLPSVTAGASLGLLALTRPWTAVAVSIPFAGHALFLLWKQPDRKWTAHRAGIVCGAAGGAACLYFAWQLAVTGNFLTNPYTLWWAYDRLGFGPGIGLQPGGFQPGDAWANTLSSFYTGNTDLFGWPVISWLFIPFGLVALYKNRCVWLLSLTSISLVAAYALYWTHTQVFGPRYYFEGIPAALVLSAAGIRWLSGRGVCAVQPVRWNLAGKLRYAFTAFALLILVGANLGFYLPARLAGMRQLSGISQACAAPIQQLASQSPAPILVFVHVQKNIHEYTCSLDLNDPLGQGKLQTAISRGREVDDAAARSLPQRQVYHYYPVTGQISSQPRDQVDPLLVIP